MKINLIGEMAKRGVKIDAVASLLGIHRNSVHNKIYGQSEFTVAEAFKIHDSFFSDCDFRHLFMSESNP